MNVIACPDIFVSKNNKNTLFLGGGISGCPDWQKEMIDRFKGHNLTLFNPRRKEFDSSDSMMSDRQIEWEHFHLKAASAIMFWFPWETLCPITLFELGKYAASGSTIFVGCHPAYARKFDVVKQLSLMRPELKVHSSFNDLVTNVLTSFRLITTQ